MLSASRVSVMSILSILMNLTNPLGAQQVTVGVRGGGNVSDLDVHETSGSVASDRLGGFAGGVFAQFDMGEVLAIRPEVVLSQKGARSQSEGLRFKANMDYVEVPLLLIARLPTTGPVRPYALAGPVVSLESRCKIELEGINGTVEDDCGSFGQGRFIREGVDFGAALGGGVELARNRLLFLADARYTLGITDINGSPGLPTFKNRALTFSAGVGLRLN